MFFFIVDIFLFNRVDYLQPNQVQFQLETFHSTSY